MDAEQEESTLSRKTAVADASGTVARRSSTVRSTVATLPRVGGAGQ
jgi:hypothetical protein